MGFYSLPPKGVWPTYSALKDIMDLEVVQWGNSMGDGTIKGTTCQHGAVECRTMMVYACDKYTATADKHAQYIKCYDDILMETFPAGLPEPSPVNMTFADASLKKCATQLGADWSALDTCASGSEGEGYFAKEKAKTPAHSGVPFVTIDGGAIIYNSQTLNLITEVCKAYTGATKPAACSTALQAERGAYTTLFTPADAVEQTA
mgnify:CR=1 FL=1